MAPVMGVVARPANSPVILGVSCFFHDAAACVLGADDAGVLRVLAAVAEERCSRRKHDRGFPGAAVTECLSLAEVFPGEVSRVAFYERPLRRAERSLVSLVARWPRGMRAFVERLPGTLGEWSSLRPSLRALGVTAPLRYVPHHLSHAADAYYASGFEHAAVLVVDGVGEWATVTLAEGKGASLRGLEEQRFPHSLGLFYAMITAHLGFRPSSDEAKVMALAATGHPTRRADLELILRGRPDGSFDLDLDYCAFTHDSERMATPRLAALLGAPRLPGGVLTEAHRDLAASVQQLLEERLLLLARRALRVTGATRLCLAGGVALNGAANGRIVRESGAEAVFVSPAPGDDGASVGAARYVGAVEFGLRAEGASYQPRLGRDITTDAALQALAEAGVTGERLPEELLLAAVVELLAAGALVGWARGRMEFGPRALGSRSILADPRRTASRDALNRRVKDREDFQPFAPLVTREDVARFFECDHSVPWMSEVHRVRAAARAQIPAVVHDDGTARVQTLQHRDDPTLYALLRAFERTSGVPVLLNTSFNGRGEPIVATARDALGAALRLGLDALVLGDVLVRPTTR
jgi:carbamoyltransferase